eukprot:2016630-Rhodomonas_salina.2
MGLRQSTMRAPDNRKFLGNNARPQQHASVGEHGRGSESSRQTNNCSKERIVSVCLLKLSIGVALALLRSLSAARARADESPSSQRRCLRAGYSGSACETQHRDALKIQRRSRSTLLWSSPH